MEKTEDGKNHPHQTFSWRTMAGLVGMVMLVAATTVSGMTVFGMQTSAAGWIWDLFDFSSLIMMNDAKAPSLQLKTFAFPSPSPAPTVVASADILNCEYAGNGPGLEGVQFDEPEILIDFAPKAPNVAGPGGAIHLWAGDENSVVLGAVSVNGTVFPIAKNTGTQTVENPQTGAPYAQGGKDAAGRPLFPALFLTDITADPNARTGDWQQGGTPIPPHFISGTWVETTIDGNRYEQSNPPGSKNVVNTIWNLAPGGTAPEPGKSYEDRTYYGAEIRWKVDQLLAAGQVQTGKTYRAQFMVHDGDGESDVAQGCVTIRL